MKQLGRLLVGVLLLALAAPAFGAIVIDFTGDPIVGATGWSYIANGTTSVSGSAIPIDKLTILGTGATDVIPTGSNVSGDCDGALFGCLNFDTASGGFLTITGTVIVNGVTLSGTLVSGYFTDGGTVVNNGVSVGVGGAQAILTGGALLSELGLTTMTVPVSVASKASGTGVGAILSTDIGGGPATVPEPASLALMGFGLVGLGLWRRRRA